MIRTVCTAGGVLTTWLGGAVLVRRERSAGSTLSVWRCLHRLESSGQHKGEVLGLGWSSPGSAFSAKKLPPRRRFVRNSKNRRPGLTGVDEARNRMRFASASKAHLRGHDRWACRVARRTGRRDTLSRTALRARAGTAKQAWIRLAPGPRGHRYLSQHWRDLRESPCAASGGAVA